MFLVSSVLIISSCSKAKLEEKGFSVYNQESDEDNTDISGLDSNKFKTRPSEVLLTGIQNIRITPIYKVNYNKKSKTTFIGSNEFYSSYYEDEDASDGEFFSHHIIPGFEIAYGYNMVNISHFNLNADLPHHWFNESVLIKNIYYPSFGVDTLNYQPVHRDYFMISVYDEDSNHDRFVNLKDLRRFYLFDSNGNKIHNLIPKEYSVFKCKYDPANDYMYVSANLDENKNGQIDSAEPEHMFWINLKNPELSGRLY
ncbi:MAG: hypothetical protein GC181_10570 [Bacteroidetes bacterium]|nr:hypothetical protein [Bacteroidota bacterium]